MINMKFNLVLSTNKNKLRPKYSSSFVPSRFKWLMKLPSFFVLSQTRETSLESSRFKWLMKLPSSFVLSQARETSLSHARETSLESSRFKERVKLPSSFASDKGCTEVGWREKMKRVSKARKRENRKKN